jgi:CBS domain-containing protein
VASPHARAAITVSGASDVTIEDVMTRRVITVRPETTVQEAARLMVANGVSGLPVIDASERVVGMVSDGDLILRQRRPKVRPWWRLFFENAEDLAREYRKLVGFTVGEVMTQPALVISPVFGIETAAAIMDNRRIRRLPVVQDGRLVGIVSRGDLIRAIAAPDQKLSEPEQSGREPGAP